MRRAIKAATKAEKSYQDRAIELGCVVCLYRIKNGMQAVGQPNATRLHHRNIGDYHGQKQIGQHAVVALCDWHHDGWQREGWTVDDMREEYGPSFKHAADFREWTYDALPDLPGKGTERWQAYQDELLEAA